MAKRDRAIELRNLALAVVRLHGTWEPVLGGPNSLKFRGSGGFIIGFRTPFQKLPLDALPELAHYLAAQARKPPPRTLPYGLDIWAPKKVLNIEWTEDDGRIDVVSYRPGRWECGLEKLAAPA